MRCKQACELLLEQQGALSASEQGYLTRMALQRPDSLEMDIDLERQRLFGGIVSAAVDLSITASRSRHFKQAIEKVIEGIQ